MDKPRIGKRAARKELRAIVRQLKGLKFRLLGLLTILPAREDERKTKTDIDDDYDAITEMRLVAQCVLHEQIVTAITSLRDAAEFEPERKKKRKKRKK